MHVSVRWGYVHVCPSIMYMMWLFAVTQQEMWLLVSDWLASPAIAISKTRIGLILSQLCSTRGLMRPSRGFCAAQFRLRCSKIILQYVLTTCPYFDNFEFNIFDAGGPQSHFICLLPLQLDLNAFSSLGQAKFSLLRSK